jgi:Cdc6-like AAA superfamily ATPase
MTKLEAIKKIRLFLKTSEDLKKVRQIALIYLDESRNLIETSQVLYDHIDKLEKENTELKKHIEQQELIIDGI